MCTWQAVTNVFDHYYLILFGVMLVTFFAVALVSARAESKIEERKQAESGKKTSWWRKYFFPVGPPPKEFRAAGYAWLVPLRRATVAALIVVVAYPPLSPTFCLNQKCEGKVNWLEPDPTCG